MKLYGSALSGNSFKARLLLHLLGVEHELVPLDLGAGEGRAPAFLALNPRGQIPTLQLDDGRAIWDSQAILAYLARCHGREWLPEEPFAMAEVMAWLAVAENELLYGLAHARAIVRFARPWDLARAQEHGRAGLALMEQHLATREWLAAGRATIADVACYPYVALAPEGEVPLGPYPSVRAWIARIQALPGYVDMEGIARV